MAAYRCRVSGGRRGSNTVRCGEVEKRTERGITSRGGARRARGRAGVGSDRVDTSRTSLYRRRRVDEARRPRRGEGEGSARRAGSVFWSPVESSTSHQGGAVRGSRGRIESVEFGGTECEALGRTVREVRRRGNRSESRRPAPTRSSRAAAELASPGLSSSSTPPHSSHSHALLVMLVTTSITRLRRECTKHATSPLLAN